MKLTQTFKAFFESERSGGIVLVAATVISLLLANSAWSESYTAIWNYQLGPEKAVNWINDALMAIFFLLIGLELEREIYTGELSQIKKAALPIVAALGGMLVPAGIYFLLNHDQSSHSGWGIPMATDIAFAIGILSLLGNRVPTSLKVFLTALAVIDDLGAILVIAIFYTSEISFLNLGISLSIWAFLFLLNRMRVHSLIPYLIGGIAMWYFMHHSGIHATITGVILAFALPYGDGGKNTISYKVQHALHYPVAFAILPLFALANTDIVLSNDWSSHLTSPLALGIIAGLVVGKPLGIWLFSWLAVQMRLCQLPKGVNWIQIGALGLLGGIGFTMSIFITLLAFNDAQHIDAAKIAILLASLIAGVLGFVLLKLVLGKSSHQRVN